MPFWTLFGLHHGKATTRWPLSGQNDGQVGVLGMPRLDTAKCEPGCDACVKCCPTAAITRSPDITASSIPEIDYGRCVNCQLCTEVCPTGAMATSGDWAFGVRDRRDLLWTQAVASADGRKVPEEISRVFGRSLFIRHVDAGSCNGCESELQALNNPFYNLHRLGIFFTPSPRFADLLLVTGPVTYAMRDVLLETYSQMPEPRWVFAMGTCAVSGGIVEGDYACGYGVDPIIPVNVYLPGCPPNPAAIISALLILLGRSSQRVHGGRIHE